MWILYFSPAVPLTGAIVDEIGEDPGEIIFASDPSDVFHHNPQSVEESVIGDPFGIDQHFRALIGRLV